MFASTRYLQWARRLYGKVRFDLATSGMPGVRLDEVGPPLPTRPDPDAGMRFREAIAAYNNVPMDEAIAALGTTQALWLAYASLTSPGDEVLVEEPAYEPLVRIAEGVGARVTRFAREGKNGFALEPERIESAMTARTRVVAVTNLHNPSGVRTPDQTLRAAARVAERFGAYLIVDEVYAPFDSLVDEQGVFRGTARKLGPNVLAVSSLSKCYGLAVERLGWLLGPSDVVARAGDAMESCCGTLPLVHAHLGIHAFARIIPLANRARAILAGKRERVADWVNVRRPNGVMWSAPTEGLFALVTLAETEDLTPVIEVMVQEQEVLVAPGSFFGVPNGFRLAWSASAKALDEGLARLGETLSRRCGIR